MITNTERIPSAAPGREYRCAGTIESEIPECRGTAPIAATVANTNNLSPRGGVVP